MRETEEQPTTDNEQPPTYNFQIIDTGMGLEEEAQATLFEPFHQEEEGMKKGGTGLGLAISKRQIELMGGRIGVESELGKGSRFFFNIPLVPAQSQIAFATGFELAVIIHTPVGKVFLGVESRVIAGEVGKSVPEILEISS
jgi:hypothetical protein